MPSIDDPRFAIPERLPFPAGVSPFRQKGNAYLADVPWLDSTVRGGFAAAVAALEDPAARAFFAQQFRSSDWYDAYPGALLEAAAARLRGVPFARHRRETGEHHARNAAGGIYRTLLRVISEENIALWGPRIGSIFFAFGKTETRVAGPRTVRAVRSGVPVDLVRWTGFAIAGFAEASLRLSGASTAECAIGDVEESGSAHGRPLFRIELTMRWV